MSLRIPITKRLITACLFVLSLVGCAAKSIQNDFVFTNEGKDGIIVLSVSHDLAGRRAASAFFYMDGGISAGGSILRSLDEVIPGTQRGSEFKDSYGHLLVLALPAGKHAIDSWQITNGAGLRVFPKENPVPLTFEVADGQVKYLGNLHANLATGKNIFGIRIVGDGYPEVRDQQLRDIQMFETKYPQFKGKIVTDLLPLGPWISPSGTQIEANVLTMPIRK